MRRQNEMDIMTAEERMSEISAILAAGVLRLLLHNGPYENIFGTNGQNIADQALQSAATDGSLCQAA